VSASGGTDILLYSIGGVDAGRTTAVSCVTATDEASPFEKKAEIDRFFFIPRRVVERNRWERFGELWSSTFSTRSSELRFVFSGRGVRGLDGEDRRTRVGTLSLMRLKPMVAECCVWPEPEDDGRGDRGSLGSECGRDRPERSSPYQDGCSETGRVVVVVAIVCNVTLMVLAIVANFRVALWSSAVKLKIVDASDKASMKRKE